MAQIENPRKKYNFSVQIAPLPINPFLVQKVTIPEKNIEVVEHGDVNYSVKTGGRATYGNITLEKLMITDGADNYMWDWAASVSDSIIGGGLVPSQYKRVLVITELAEDGTSILNTWVCTGCWPSKINGQDLDRVSSENSMESIELCVDIVEKL